MDIDIDIEPPDNVQYDLACGVCCAEFLDKEDLELHIKQIHLNETNRSRFCDLCTHIFRDIGEYALHLRNTHLGSLKCCKYCTRLFKSTSEVQEHEKRHNSAVLYPKVSCSHCKNVFETKDEVKNHELKEHIDSDDGLMLRDCSSILSALLCMNVRDFLTALSSSRPYVCVGCDKMTADIEEYIQHTINSKCRSYACHECCNVYANKRLLRRHITRMHCRKKSYALDFEVQCRKCKVTLKAASLKSHTKTCTGMCCALCDLAFNSVDEYTKHRLAEHQTKLPSFETCVYCQRQFLGAVSLKKHFDRIHKNDKHLYRYNCTDCNRIFKHPKLLFAHFFSQHKDLHPYTCRICDKTFRMRKSFTLHIKLDHKSIGFVKFDDNFHVFFTDKKSVEQSKSQTVLANVNDDKDCEDTDKCEVEDECEIENSMEKSNGSDDQMLEKPKETSSGLGNELKPNDISVTKSNEKKHKIVEEKLATDGENVDIVKKPVENTVQKTILKRKRKVVQKCKIEHASDGVDESDDSDIPLQRISKKLKTVKIGNSNRKFYNKSAKSKKFVCDKCHRNCYTYQNYHRHRALHFKTKTKVCIKCYGKFDSVKKLDEHMKKEHSSSELTETLKKLLEKRKIAGVKPKELPKFKQTSKLKEIENAKKVTKQVMSTSEKFRNTFKKFNTEKNQTTRVTMKLVDKDKISVKKYLENFMPDNSEVKITMIQNKSSSNSNVKKPQPLIKLTKITTEPARETQEVSLRMPIKFRDDSKEKFDVSIKIVSDYQPPAMTFLSKFENSSLDENHVDSYVDYDTHDACEEETETKDVIPEVAQEVMLEGTVEQTSIVHNLKNLPTWHNIQIAHLAPEAPFYRISKINLEKESVFTLAPEKFKRTKDAEQEVPVFTPSNVTLPNGKTLVSVNPFEHLLNEKTIQVLKNTNKNQKYYKPRISNVAEAIKTAMERLEQAPSLKKKKQL